MAIGADRAKIGNGIEFILTVSKCERLEMMNMNEVLPDCTIPRLKVKATHCAVVSVMTQACLPYLWVAFVGIYAHLLLCAFNVFLPRFEFVREQPLPCSNMDSYRFAIFTETFPCRCNLCVGKEATELWLKNYRFNRKLRSIRLQ